MTGMIRLQPTQILLTNEEVSKALYKFCPTMIESLSSPEPPSWDHKITTRRNKGTRSTRITHKFSIHEDPSLNETVVGETDSGEISDMSDFSFGPILFGRVLRDGNTPPTEASSSSKAEYESSNDEMNSQSTSWDGRHSVTTLTNNSPASDTLIASNMIDGSIYSADEQQNRGWDAYSDGFASNGVHEESFIDIDYLADVELSVDGDEESSGKDSDPENHVQESYTLPMDGSNEDCIREKFAGMNLYASPVAPSQDNERSRGFFSRNRGTPRAPGIASIPPTSPSVLKLLEKVSPRLDVAGLSPRHVAISHARLARYRSRNLQQQTPTEKVAGAQEEDNGHPWSRASETSLFFNSSPPLARFQRRAMTIGTRFTIDMTSEANTDDSDGGIRIMRQSSEVGPVANGGSEQEINELDKGGK